MTPFFLANFVDASDAKVYKRRIYIDLGIKDFDSSLCWIMQHYPVKFDAMHGFECQKDLTDVAALKGPIDHCISGTAAEKMGYTTEGMMDMLNIYHNYIGLDEDSKTSPETRGLGQFLQDIGVQEDDFVVLKMDVEGIEFDLLERIMADGNHKLIDEVGRKGGSHEKGREYAILCLFYLDKAFPVTLQTQIFVEVHYHHPDMQRHGWDHFEHSRSDAQVLFTKARDMGVYIHPWP